MTGTEHKTTQTQRTLSTDSSRRHPPGQLVVVVDVRIQEKLYNANDCLSRGKVLRNLLAQDVMDASNADQSCGLARAISGRVSIGTMHGQIARSRSIGGDQALKLGPHS